MVVGGGGRIALSTKARVRRSELLSSKDFRALLEQPSVSAVAASLDATSYGKTLEGLSLNEVRRTELEFRLGTSVLREALAFRSYMGAGYRRLLDLWLQVYDIEFFKDHFRRRFGADPTAAQEEERMFGLFPDFRPTLLDRNALLAAQTPGAMLASIRDERLRAALKETLPVKDDGAEVLGEDACRVSFALGMTLDRYYLDSLYKAVLAVGGMEGRLLARLVGVRLDLVNLYWIYRCRRFFGLSPEQALATVTRSRCRVDFDLLSRAASSELPAWDDVLEGTPYAGIFRSDEEDPSIEEDPSLREAEVELRLCRVLCRVAGEMFRSGAPGWHNVGAYLMLKGFEVRDLITVIEAVRYDYDRRRVGRLLILNGLNGGEGGGR